MKSAHTALVFACFSLFSSVVLAGTAPKDTHSSDQVIGMVTGERTGTYIAIGKDITRVAAKNGVIVRVYDSSGSIDNIQRITSKEKVGLAIVQSDVLGFLRRAPDEKSHEMAKKLRLVAPLYEEEVHVLARSNIPNIQALAGKRVVVGGENSGSVITANNIFTTLGIVPAKMYEVEPARGAVAVFTGQVDAMVYVGGKPLKMFKNLEQMEQSSHQDLSQVHFLPVDDTRLLREYHPAVLTHNDYSFIKDDVPTVAATALLITYDYKLHKGDYYSDHCQNMGKLVRALRDNMADLRATGHEKWKEVNLSTPVEGNWEHDPCSASALTSAEPTTPKAIVAVPVASAHASPLEKNLLGAVRAQ